MKRLEEKLRSESSFCSKCGSSRVKRIPPQTWFIWECKNCGYKGPIIIKDSELAVGIREKYLKTKRLGRVKKRR